MSTRGYIGYRKDRNTVVFKYNHSDSYPSGLLTDIIECGADWDVFQELGEDDDELGMVCKVNFEKIKDGNPFRLDGNDDEDMYLFIEYVYIIDEIENKIWCIENIRVPTLPEDKYAWRVFAIVDRDVMDKFIDYLVKLEEMFWGVEIGEKYDGFQDIVKEAFGSIEITKENFDEKRVKKFLMIEKL